MESVDYRGLMKLKETAEGPFSFILYGERVTMEPMKYATGIRGIGPVQVYEPDPFFVGVVSHPAETPDEDPF